MKKFYEVNVFTKIEESWTRFSTYEDRDEAEKMFDILSNTDNEVFGFVEIQEICELDNGDFDYKTIKSDISDLGKDINFIKNVDDNMYVYLKKGYVYEGGFIGFTCDSKKDFYKKCSKVKHISKAPLEVLRIYLNRICTNDNELKEFQESIKL